MHLILCCANATLRERWVAALRPFHGLYQTSSLRELGILMGQKVPLDLLLLHRSLVSRESIIYMREKLPQCKIFLLSDRPDETEGLEFIRLGVVGYANSYSSAERLQGAVRVIVDGAVWINQQLMQRLIRESAVPVGDTAGTEIGAQGSDRRAVPSALAQLSNREHQIAGLVAAGHSNFEIAEELGISERTVKAHLSAVYAKTATPSRLTLALLFQQTQQA